MDVNVFTSYTFVCGSLHKKELIPAITIGVALTKKRMHDQCIVKLLLREPDILWNENLKDF